MRDAPDAGFVNFDANASEPIRPQAVQAMLEAAHLPGNPASPHRDGRSARMLLDAARRQIAEHFGARPDRLIFTSGGTEANALAIHKTGRRVLYGATEHDCIRNAAPPGASVIGVDENGCCDLLMLDRVLSEDAAPALVCLMAANNETGVIHPIAEAAELCRARGAWLHVDAVQAAGRMKLDFSTSGADSIAVSAHKLGGPKGAGALLLGPARDHRILPLIAGGGQEEGRRGGTPALPAIAGFAAALQAAEADRSGRFALQAGLRDAIEQAAVKRGAVVFGGEAERLANTSCIALPGRRAEAQLIALDLAGFAVSAGSACSSGKVARSHVLEAMGAGSLAGEAIRVSLPWDVDRAQVEGFVAAYRMMVERRRTAA